MQTPKLILTLAMGSFSLSALAGGPRIPWPLPIHTTSMSELAHSWSSECAYQWYIRPLRRRCEMSVSAWDPIGASLLNSK